MPEEFACKFKGPDKIIRILIRLMVSCLNESQL